ncbi:MAG: type III pantothenate kinase, partial [Planctomycetes bacterium]|nr:type III pantothenate kinase [Planctomycetota bacterium]
MVLGLLLGNSSVRYGVHDGAGIRARGRIEWPELAARGGEIRRAALELGARCAIVGSVRDDLFPAVELWIPRQLLPASFARRDFVVPIENRYERPEEAGTDRLLAAVAARERARGRCAVVVDFGTAISITVV